VKKILKSILKPCFILFSLSLIAAIIFFLWLKLLAVVKLIDKTESLDKKWIAVVKYEDEGYLMFTPPSYTIYIKSNSNLPEFLNEKKIFEVEYTDDRPPAIIWKENNSLIINKADNKAEVYTQLKKYQDINILYDVISSDVKGISSDLILK
jgi:hypothetical protein